MARRRLGRRADGSRLVRAARSRRRRAASASGLSRARTTIPGLLVATVRGRRWRRPPPPETPEMIAAQVDGAMGRWRTAILVKDAPAVIALDMTFRQMPERYTPALATSAETRRERAGAGLLDPRSREAQEPGPRRRSTSGCSPTRAPTFARTRPGRWASWARPARPAVAELQQASAERSGERRPGRRQGRPRQSSRPSRDRDGSHRGRQTETKTDRTGQEGLAEAAPSRAVGCSSPTAWPAARTVPGMESCEQFPKMS